jgi:hypothetical protein
MGRDGRSGQPEAAKETNGTVIRVPATAGLFERESAFAGSIWHGFFS